MTDLHFEFEAVLANSHVVGMERRWRAIAEAMLLETPDGAGAWDRIRPFARGADLVATGSVDGGSVEMRLISGPDGNGPFDLVPEWAVRLAGAAILKALDPTPQALDLSDMHRERAAHIHASQGLTEGRIESPTPWSPGHEAVPALPQLLGVHLLVGGMVEHVRVSGYSAEVDALGDPLEHMRLLAAWKRRPEFRA